MAGRLSAPPAALARSFTERVEKTPLQSSVPAGLAHRLSGGGQVRVDDVRWHDRTVHLSAVLQEA